MIKKILTSCLLTVFIYDLSFAAFPQVAGEVETDTVGNVTTHPINYPSGIQEDNLLIACVAVDDGSETVSFPVGWTLIDDHSGGGVAASCEYLVADGTETGTFNVTTVDNEESNAIVWRINDYELPATQAPEGFSGTGGNVNPNAPSLTPTGGAEDFLWIAFASVDVGDFTVSVTPTNYTNIGHVDGGSIAALYGRRELNASSEDPSAWTISNSRAWRTITIAVHPGLEGEATGAPLLLLGQD